MSGRTKVKIEGGGGKRGVGRRNNSRNNIKPNNNANSKTSNIRELENAMYIVIQFSLDDTYEKVTKEIIRYVIRQLCGGVYFSCGMCEGKIRNMSLNPNPKQKKKPDGASALEKDKYKLKVLECKDNAKIEIERKRHMNEGNQ